MEKTEVKKESVQPVISLKKEEEGEKEEDYKKEEVVVREKKEGSSSKSAVDIQDVISCQASDGSWKDLKLMKLLFSKEVEELVKKESDQVVIITYLVAKWIEKYYPESQYSLLVKKGFSFIKKQSRSL